MKVRELMTDKVAYVQRSANLSDAARLMWDCDCGAIPVVEDDSQSVVGMITDRDICMACWSKDRPPSSIPVVEAMSPDLFRCSPDDSLTAAESLMRSTQVRRIPVVDAERKLLGILSLADIVTRAQRAGIYGAGASRELAPTEITTTLATICQPKSAPLTAAPV